MAVQNKNFTPLFSIVIVFNIVNFLQQECKKLEETVTVLTKEGNVLADELMRVSEECVKLTGENESILVSHLNLTTSSGLLLCSANTCPEMCV